MKKTKNKLKKIGNYFRELSIITIGVAITLAVSAWISNLNNKKDLALYLDAIKLELQENIKYIEEKKGQAQIDISYANYLRSVGKNSINVDSALFYLENNVLNIVKYSFKTNAFDMFQASGMMRLIKDKELLLTLWNTYNQLNLIETQLNKTIQMKTDEVMLEYRSESGFFPILYTFFAVVGIPHEVSGILDDALTAARESLSAL